MKRRHLAGAMSPSAAPYDADIIILALDRMAETEAAIASALAQTGVSRHLTVIDQGCRPEMVARLADIVDGRDDATLVTLGGNFGVPAGRNAGSSFGQGRVIVALDNDAEFDATTTVQSAIAAIDEDPGLAAIGFRIVEHATGRDDLSSWGYPTALLPRSGETFGAVTFVGAGHAIRRAAWEQAGGYDAALFFCWEEYDFCLRAIQRGWQVRYRGDIVVRHKVSAERRVAWSGDRWFHFVRNRLLIERKWGASWLALVPRMVGYAIRGTRYGHMSATARAIRAAAALSRTAGRQRLSDPARHYLVCNDRAHRGSLQRRFASVSTAGRADRFRVSGYQ
jgi:GT2 family glycosyltransferase